jgi:signal transduction histidine kinase
MENYEILQKKPSSDSQPHLLNEQVLNMVKIMSHDIRGALISMLATLKLLNRGYYGKMEEAAANRIKDLLSNATSLTAITEEYLGRAFLVDDDLEIEQEVLDLRQDIIDPVLDEFSVQLEDHPILINDCIGTIRAPHIPIKGSRVWLKSVFRNLLKNAIKYGDEGCPIMIGFQKHGSSYRLNVFNKGKLSPEEWRHKLFTKVVRFENNGNGSTNGLGLGLYLTRKIIRQHGGEIWYEAKEDGSHFVFTLPCGI